MDKIPTNIFYKIQKAKYEEEERIFQLNEERKLNIMIIDDFYENPIKVRDSISLQITELDIKKMQNVIQKCIEMFGQIDDFSNIPPLNLYSITSIPHEDKSVILQPNNRDCTFYKCFENHNNANTDYVAIICLTSDGPLQLKTTLYKSNIVFDEIEHKFNRMIIIHANEFYTLNNSIDTKLIQVYWFTLLSPLVKQDCLDTPTNESVSKIPILDMVLESKIDTDIDSNEYLYKLNPNKNVKLIVVDNFYKNPIEIRNFALSQNYNVVGNYPGYRTKPFLKKKIQNVIKKYIKIFTNKTINVIPNHEYNGALQYTIANNKSWVHIDGYNELAGLIYLTPNAPSTSGTTFYEYHDKNADIESKNIHSQDMTKWKEVDVIGNVFNRFIFFDSKVYHMSRDYFGTDIVNGRLFQVFFI